MLISISVSAGFQQKIRDKMAGFKGHIQIANYDNNNSEVSTIPINKNQSFYPEFTDVDGVKNVQVFANRGGILRTAEEFEGIVFKGVSTDYDWTFFKDYLVEGRVPNFDLPRSREILLSKTVADRLNLKLNDEVNAFFLKNKRNSIPSKRKLTIVGIYDTGFQQFDGTMMIGDIREVQRLNKWNENQVGGFEVLIDDFDKLEGKGEEIYANIPSTLNSTTIVEGNPAIFEWIQLFDNNVWFIIIIMIVIAGINMITALLVLILERVQMVGILKALGSNNWGVRKIFLYNATYLVLKGLFWGNLLGILLLVIQHFFGVITLDPSTYYVAKVPVYFNLLAIVLLNLGTLILCFLMLIIPSYIITKIHPSKSIRFA